MVGTATFVLIIVLILIVFRSPIAALLPIVVIGVVLQVSSNLIAAAGKLFDFTVDQSPGAGPDRAGPTPVLVESN